MTPGCFNPCWIATSTKDRGATGMSGRSRAAREALARAAGADAAPTAGGVLADNLKVVGDIDRNIALRLRALRIKAGMSQTTLGQAAGVSFQQMQKYEHARDRISASTLQRFATALNVQAGWFFESGKVPRGETTSLNEGLRVARNVQSIADDHVRRRLVDFIDALAKDDAAASNLVQRRLMALANSISGMPLPGGPELKAGELDRDDRS